MRYFFEGCELDTDRRELTLDNVEVSLEPKVFDVLEALVINSDRMMTKEELLDGIWGDRFVSESSLSGRIKAARRAVGDNGRDQAIIQTVHGRGFKLVVPVRAESEAGTGVVERAPSAQLSTASDNAEPERTNLSRRRDVLIGREEELDRILQAAESADLVSVVGPGGAGKTSLGKHVAHELLPEHRGGVWFCEFAPVGADQLASTVLGAIDSSAGIDSPQPRDIADRIAGEPSVVVFDNCEHVIEAAADLAEHLIDLSEKLTILTTSREPLDMRGEHVVRVGGLECDHVESAAVELFVKRATELGESLDDVESRHVVHEIVDRLEGLPLAIELAVPRLVSRSPAELLAAMDDQMTVLASRRRRDDRQSAMDRVISWSYELLSDEEQRALRECSVFAAPFTAEAARSVSTASDVDDLLHRLIEQSMVSRESMVHGTRFRLLEPIRQFVEALLDEADAEALIDRHAAYFAKRVIALAAELRTEAEPQVADLLTAEWPDIIRAVSRGRETLNPAVAIDPLVALGFHLYWQQRMEGFAWLDTAAELIGPLGERQAEVDLVRSLGAFGRADPVSAMNLLESSVAAGGHTVATSFIRSYLGMVSSDFELLVQASEETWQLAQTSDDESWIGPAAAFRLIGRVMSDPSDPDLDALTEEVDRQIEETDWPSSICWGLLSHVTKSVRVGDAESAIRFRNELERVATECRSPWFSQIGGAVSSRLADQADDRIAHLASANKSMRAVVAARESTHYPIVFRSAVMALASADQHVVAAQIVGLVEATAPINEVQEVLVEGYEPDVERIAERLGPEEMARLEAIGRRLGPDQAAELVDSAFEVAKEQQSEA